MDFIAPSNIKFFFSGCTIYYYFFLTLFQRSKITVLINPLKLTSFLTSNLTHFQHEKYFSYHKTVLH